MISESDSQDNRQGYECQVNYECLLKYDNLLDDYQKSFSDLMRRQLNDIDEHHGIFPLPSGQAIEPKHSIEVCLQNLSCPRTNSQVIMYDQASLNHMVSLQSSEQSGDQNQQLPAADIDVQLRSDPHDLAQNISSKSKTLVGKVMSQTNQKDEKKNIIKSYSIFLKEHKVTYSQIVLAFSYLFLVKNTVAEPVYAKLKEELLKYFHKKWEQARQKQDPIMRNGLFVKINANIELIQYLFQLKGQKIINFQKVKNICEPLFSGKQASKIKKLLEKAQKIQERLWLLGGQRSPIAAKTRINSKTSKSSIGCQVNL